MSKSFLHSIQKVFLRDLDKLEKEICLYPDMASLWKVDKQIANSAGNLCLHLCGNLQYYIGAVLGNSDYIRDREKEFSAKNLSAKELVVLIMATKEAIRATFPKLEGIDLEQPYPVKVFEEPVSTQYFLIHLAGHLNYHLGQVNYHRRLLA